MLGLYVDKKIDDIFIEIFKFFIMRYGYGSFQKCQCQNEYYDYVEERDKVCVICIFDSGCEDVEKFKRRKRMVVEIVRNGSRICICVFIFRDSFVMGVCDVDFYYDNNTLVWQTCIFSLICLFYLYFVRFFLIFVLVLKFVDFFFLLFFLTFLCIVRRCNIRFSFSNVMTTR